MPVHQDVLNVTENLSRRGLLVPICNTLRMLYLYENQMFFVTCSDRVGGNKKPPRMEAVCKKGFNSFYFFFLSRCDL
jgi:hypothetical protein